MRREYVYHMQSQGCVLKIALQCSLFIPAKGGDRDLSNSAMLLLTWLNGGFMSFGVEIKGGFYLPLYYQFAMEPYVRARAEAS